MRGGAVSAEGAVDVEGVLRSAMVGAHLRSEHEASQRVATGGMAGGGVKGVSPAG